MLVVVAAAEAAAAVVLIRSVCLGGRGGCLVNPEHEIAGGYGYQYYYCSTDDCW